MKEPKPKPPVRQGAPMTLVMHARGLTFDPRGKRFALAEDGTVTSDSSAFRAGGSGVFVVERVTTAMELIAALDGLVPGIVVLWGDPPAEIGDLAKSGDREPGERRLVPVRQTLPPVQRPGGSGDRLRHAATRRPSRRWSRGCGRSGSTAISSAAPAPRRGSGPSRRASW